MPDSDRIHEPSPIRLIQARNDGIVARSGELVRSLIVCVTIGSILMFVGTAQSIFETNIKETFSSVQIRTTAIHSNDLTRRVADTLTPILFLFVGMVVLAVVFWHIQFPLKFTPQKTTPDFNRISPIAALTRILSVDSFAKAAISFLGLIAFVAIGFSMVLYQPEIVLGIFGENFRDSLSLAGQFVKNFLLATGACVIFFGAVDYIRERIKIASQLRMTDSERRDEAREHEPSPLHRQRLSE